MTKKLNGYKGNDVELCRTVSDRVGDKTAQALLEQRIPFTRNVKRIPFFQREKYAGATSVTIISINPHRYGQARRIIDSLDRIYKDRLVLSNY